MNMTRLAGSAKLLRAMNQSAALGHLLDSGSLTRGDLRELTGLSKPTTSEVLRRLTDAGLAIIVGHTSGGPGPNAEIYAANPEAAYTVAVAVREPAGCGRPRSREGIDRPRGWERLDRPCGQERAERPPLAVAMSDLTGAIRSRAEIPVDLDSGAAPAITAAILGQCAEVGLDPARLRHAQLGVPGSYDPRTDAVHHVHVPGLQRPGLVRELSQRLSTRVGVDNDVNLAAVAERRRGVGAGTDGFVLLWFGEGLGLAIDLDGTLLRSARGGAGEIGYMPLGVRPRGGDLHDAVGGPAVLALARGHGITATSPAEAVRRGGPAMLAELAERIAVALAAVIAVLDPPLVVLAGEVGQAGGTALRDAVRDATRSTSPFDTEIATTGVSDDAVLLGALDAGLASIRDELIHTIRAGRLTPGVTQSGVNA
jgi:predicted NBD/HSP70 family sugar kinase/DNA-binding transcriptional ArsR family regulator